MDSSPDLSLKLRRGSSDSRDSFYMDFAQGIDSDIEEVTTTGPPTTVANDNSIDDLESPSVPQQLPPSLPLDHPYVLCFTKKKCFVLFFSN